MDEELRAELERKGTLIEELLVKVERADTEREVGRLRLKRMEKQLGRMRITQASGDKWESDLRSILRMPPPHTQGSSVITRAKELIAQIAGLEAALKDAIHELEASGLCHDHPIIVELNRALKG